MYNHTFKISLLFLLFSLISIKSIIIILPPESQNLTNLTTIPLINNQNLDYLINVTIGSQNQSFTLLINTNSPLTYIGVNLTNTSLFSCNTSQGCFDTNQIQNLTIENITVYGDVINDTIAFGNVTLTNQSIIALNATELTPDLTQSLQVNMTPYLVQGALGLGFNPNNISILDSLVAQGILQQQNYSIYFSNYSADPNASSLIFGGFDPNHLQTSNFTYLPLAANNDWIVNLTNITLDTAMLGEISFSKATQAVFAGGEPNIVAAYADYLLLVAALTTLEQDCSLNNQTNLACTCGSIEQLDSFPNLTFRFVDVNNSNANFTLRPQDYVIWQNQTCTLQIVGTPGYDMWLLGAPFLRAYYSFWDLTNKQIGLARLY